jgi:peptidoglycan-associated lipoprotein
MMMRELPALCAGLLMLAACTDSGAQNEKPSAPPSTSMGMLTPGHEEIEYGNIGNTVYFATDSALLMPEAQLHLQKQALWIHDFPQFSITIEGHADERGTREYNLALGERRAQAVANYLIALGVDAKRLKTISFGKERPTCTEATEDCWSRNRRTVTTLDQ